MTPVDTAASWTSHAQRLADQLTSSGALHDPAWHAAVTATPRHVLVPQEYELRPDLTGSDAATALTGEAGLARVYSPTTLITAIDHNECGAVVPVSSSTKPDLMVRMLELLDIHDDHRVLEIGTGTGYNAALLCHRLGDDHVVSVDVDPDLVALARQRLARIGYHPTLVTADGSHELPGHAPFDRIIATCGARRIPWSWHTHLAEGGKVLVDCKPHGHGNLVLLRKRGDRLEGHFAPTYGAFMLLRHPGHNTEPGNEPWKPELPFHTQRTTSTPAELPAVVWFLRSLWSDTAVRLRRVPDQHPHQAAMTLTIADGSHCAINLQSNADGSRTVREAGPTAIWSDIEHIDQQWHAWNEPGWPRFGLTVTHHDHTIKHTIWLDEPHNTIGTIA